MEARTLLVAPDFFSFIRLLADRSVKALSQLDVVIQISDHLFVADRPPEDAFGSDPLS